MKKLIALILAAAMLCGCAMAEAVNAGSPSSENVQITIEEVPENIEAKVETVDEEAAAAAVTNVQAAVQDTTKVVFDDSVADKEEVAAYIATVPPTKVVKLNITTKDTGAPAAAKLTVKCPDATTKTVKVVLFNGDTMMVLEVELDENLEFELDVPEDFSDAEMLLYY